MKNLFSGRSYEYFSDDEENRPTEVMATNHFKTLDGLTLDYYGADAGDNTFKVDGVIFKVLEDPDDGYRSHLGTIDYTDQHNSIFFSTPIARVKIETYDCDDNGGYGKNQGYRLVDVDDGHVWLEFGTHNYADYYPCFIFRHMAKATPLTAKMGEACPELRNGSIN